MTATPDRSVEAPQVSRVSGDLPEHVAFIMDGNGRWAKARGLPRTEGHRHGLEALRRTVRHAVRIGLKYMTIYSFSSENWRRPEGEVSFLMGLLRRFLQRDLTEIHNANVRIKVIGERDDLEPSILKLLVDAEHLTRNNTGLTLVVAFNYGARDEITRAVGRLAKEVAEGRISPDEVNERAIEDRLDTAGIPDPDLIIRTSGEQRLSNFLMWQAAYAEFYFCPTYWPDFDAADFDAALDAFYSRDRRFGGLTAKAL
ncbi:Undecaprenyl pyrophosphate synthetase [Roseibium hamelinense]|uniref:Isoprenyl transferase n=1 Tax=Roseibium hamelinense TaxID=150831 RepID=A0A562TH03_9HYPH|nr:isoprenyl transferase [Roseibium hamelinense]MTI45969.1 isoprenyl transferase [Roseibium hamelinense]TWI92842.1 Undecaprenyl pyrophosphate synthetase [Roseibium hamelinense]